MTKKIVIPYFSLFFKYLTPFIFGGSIYLFVKGYPAWAVILILFGVIVLTTKYVTEIDMGNKRYYDYLAFLGMKLNNETQRFEQLIKIVITKGNYSQTINTRVQSRQLDWSDYTATLIFDHGKTLDLLTRNDKHELLVGLKPFAAFLNVDVEDCSTNHHYWVDLNRV